jgi:hypothetical protein
MRIGLFIPCCIDAFFPEVVGKLRTTMVGCES